MLDIEPAKEALEGVRMELIDAALPLLSGSFVTCIVCIGCNIMKRLMCVITS